MIKNDFFVEDHDIWSSYSSILLLGVAANQVIDALEKIDPKMEVANGYEFDGGAGFDVFGELPDLVYDLTEKLHCIGYADTAWDAYYIVVAKNGKDYDGYTASWEVDDNGDAKHHLRDDGEWDAFVVLKDKKTGIVFDTGAGAVDSETEQYYASIVYSHPAA